MTDRRARALVLSLSGIAGVVAAHVVAYRFAYPNHHMRMMAMMATGHSYWTCATWSAVVAGAAAVIVAFVSSMRQSQDRDDVHFFGRSRFGHDCAALLIWQIAIFTIVEHGERVLAHASMRGLVLERPFLFGLVAQFVVVGIVVAVLAFVGRLAKVVGRALRRRLRFPRASVARSFEQGPLFVGRRVGAVLGRAPPLHHAL